MKEQYIAGIKKALHDIVPERRLSHLSEETLLSDLGIDSLDMVQFVLGLEHTFEISLSDNDLSPENFNAVSSLVQLLERKKNEGEQQ